jgi:hypothetical protein
MERPVWDTRQAKKLMPRQPDILEVMEQQQD